MLIPESDNAELSRTVAGTATLKLARMRESELFCTPIEERFERITRLARLALRVTAAAVTLINDEKQWFKSVSGWNISELPLDRSLCRLLLERGQTTVVEDAARDPATKDHPLVSGSPGFRFYAAQPLRDADGATVGTFCIFDRQPRHFSAAERQAFADLATLAQRELYADQLTNAHSKLVSKLGVARREAMMDPLTRLWNRRGAQVMLKAACEEGDADNLPLAIALLDLDDFKRINDTYGHQVGDDVLRRSAARLIGVVRSGDLVCRIGGDEFMIVMSGADGKTAAEVAERARTSMTDSALATRQGGIRITVSIGYTVRQPKEPFTFERLLERADRGLLKSKAAGRDTVRCAD
jgi:diguanylate cyclase (GGDEF)-like protein